MTRKISDFKYKVRRHVPNAEMARLSTGGNPADLVRKGLAARLTEEAMRANDAAVREVIDPGRPDGRTFEAELYVLTWNDLAALLNDARKGERKRIRNAMSALLQDDEGEAPGNRQDRPGMPR